VNRWYPQTFPRGAIKRKILMRIAQYERNQAKRTPMLDVVRITYLTARLNLPNLVSINRRTMANSIAVETPNMSMPFAALPLRTLMTRLIVI